MCRLLYILNKNYDKKIIYKFLNQSIKKKYTPLINSPNDHDYNKDGFGFIWKNENNEWMLYKNTLCYTEDTELDNIINKIKNKILIGHIRSICKNNKKINYYNTHPFIYKNNIWCHNGCISDIKNFKNEVNDIIINKYKNNIKGNTDSEYLFYLYLSIMENNIGSLLDKMIQTTIIFFNYLKKKKYRSSTNIIYSNDNYSLISRFINKNEDAPSLYYNNKDNNIIISSEPVTNNYQIFQNQTAIIIDIKTNKIIVNLKLNKFV